MICVKMEFINISYILMSMQVADREDIYDERYQKFLKTIKDYESKELRKVTQKCKDEQEF